MLRVGLTVSQLTLHVCVFHPQLVAVADFTAEADGDLSFRAGDEFELLGKGADPSFLQAWPTTTTQHPYWRKQLLIPVTLARGIIPAGADTHQPPR